MYTEKEKELMEEINNEIDRWRAIKDSDIEEYPCSSNKEENEKNLEIMRLSREIYAYYFNLKEHLEYIIECLNGDCEEYYKLTGRK